MNRRAALHATKVIASTSGVLSAAFGGAVLYGTALATAPVATTAVSAVVATAGAWWVIYNAERQRIEDTDEEK